MRRSIALLCVVVVTASAAPLTVVTNVEFQPLHAQAQRVARAMAFLGAPLSDVENEELQSAAALAPGRAVDKIQTLLDRHVLFGVTINPEMRVKVAPGPAKPELDEQGWRVFLVKVVNDAGTTAPLKATSPNAKKMAGSDAAEIVHEWLDLAMFDAQPLTATLSGLGLEYRIIQLYSRDAGKREAKFEFNVGQGTQDLGYRSEVDVLFTARPANEVVWRVRDENGAPTTASFLIRDEQNRVYPALSKRLAPDFSFHSQIYRSDGEKVKLPTGTYSIEVMRGPESIVKKSTHQH